MTFDLPIEHWAVYEHVSVCLCVFVYVFPFVRKCVWVCVTLLVLVYT